MLQKIITFLCVCLLVFPVSVFVMSARTGSDEDSYAQAESYLARKEDTQGPCAKADGSKFTIGYLDIDPYPATGEMIYRFVEQLRKDGWITYRGELPSYSSDT